MERNEKRYIDDRLNTIHKDLSEALKTEKIDEGWNDIMVEEINEVSRKMKQEFPQNERVQSFSGVSIKHGGITTISGQTRHLLSQVRKMADMIGIKLGSDNIKEENNVTKSTTSYDDKTGERLSNLQNEINEAKMEAERRKAVLESKIYGANIEIITALRQELKRRDETTQIINELKSRIVKLEESRIKISDSQPQEYQEDKWLNEILKNIDPTDPEFSDSRTQAKELYTKIKAIREEIVTLEKNLAIASNTPAKDSILKIIAEAGEDLGHLLDRLGVIWSNFSK